MVNSRVPKNRQTENLGDFDGFQPSGMPTFQILRFAEIEINPCNSTSNTGTKKAEWRVTIRHQDKKMVEDYFNRKTANAKLKVLQSPIKSAGILHFIKIFTGRDDFPCDRRV